MPISKNKEQIIIELYNNKNSINTIEKIEHISRPTIRKILRKNNIRNVYKQDIDHSAFIKTDFFDEINTEEKAYFLGLLFADGNIYLGSKQRKHYSLSINLIESDKYILEKLRDLIAPRHKLYFVNKKKKNINQNNQYKLLFDSKKICESLISHGCDAKKSLKLNFPTHIRNDLLSHFMRGHFDGDGCICGYLNKNIKIYSYSIASTKQFITYSKNIIKNKFEIDGTVYTRKNNITSELIIGGNQQVYRLMSWLYQDATIYLKRKHDKYLELEKLINYGNLGSKS